MDRVIRAAPRDVARASPPLEPAFLGSARVKLRARRPADWLLDSLAE